MKFALALILLLIAANLSAQTTITFDTSVTTTSIPTDAPLPAARDFWFTPTLVQYDTLQPTYTFSIVSTKNATAHFQIGTQPAQKFTAHPDSTYCVTLDPNDVHHASDSIRHNGIHVWCDSADLTITLSQRYYDLAFAVASTACDTEYVIAAPTGTTKTDSGYGVAEFTITATQDSTLISVLPSCNIMRGVRCKDIAHVAGTAYTVMLRLGESVMYMASCEAGSSHELTGTQLHASAPIAVVAGSYLGAIEMLTPPRSWGKLYYVLSSPATLIGTHDDQVIRNGTDTLCVLNKRFDAKINANAGSRIDSDDPFLLVEYGGTTKFSLAISPDRFATTIRFASIYSAPGYWDEWGYRMFIVDTLATYARIDGLDLSRMHWLSTTRVDGYRIYFSPYDPYPSFTWPHTFESDRPAAVEYNVRLDTSYYLCAPPVNMVGATSASATAPSVAFTQSVSCLRAAIAQYSIGISSLTIDSLQNFRKTIDPKFKYGVRSTYLDLCLIDSLKPAKCIFKVAAPSGNESDVTIAYTPHPRLLSPGFVVTPPAFDTCLIGTSKVLEFSLVDTSLLAITIDNIWTSEPAFVYDRTWAQNKLPLTLIPGEPKTLSLKFGPSAQRRYDEHLNFHSSATGNVSVPISGIGYYPLEAVREVTGPDVVVTAEGSRLIVRGSGNFALVNTLGEAVLESRINGGGDIDVANIPVGVYFYKMTEGSRVRKGKISLP